MRLSRLVDCRARLGRDLTRYASQPSVDEAATPRIVTSEWERGASRHRCARRGGRRDYTPPRQPKVARRVLARPACSRGCAFCGYPAWSASKAPRHTPQPRDPCTGRIEGTVPVQIDYTSIHRRMQKRCVLNNSTAVAAGGQCTCTTGTRDTMSSTTKREARKKAWTQRKEARTNRRLPSQRARATLRLS